MRVWLDSASAARWASEADWPRTRWELSAPASYVLLHGSQTKGAEAFKLAVLELVAKGALRLVQAQRSVSFGRRKPISILADAATSPRIDAPELQTVHRLFRSMSTTAFADGSVGIAVESFALAARMRYGSLAKYATNEVVPPLVRRGLFRSESYRLLWIVPATRHVLTPEGQGVQAELRQQLAVAERQFGSWVDGDLARAAAFVSLAGASLLLVNSLYPDLQRLQQEMALARAADASSGSTTTDSGYSGTDSGEGIALAGGFDLGGLDIGLDFSTLDFDFGAFENLGDAFSAIDSAVDSGGGDSSGGDGGGDGGGGD